MAHRKTHRRRHHSKRKTSRRVHRRRTHRRGGANNVCGGIRGRLDNMRVNLNQQSANTIEDFVGEVRALYDEAKDKGCSQNLLDEIEQFELGPVGAKTNSLLRVNNNVIMN
jgi:hypothetical protein